MTIRGAIRYLLVAVMLLVASACASVMTDDSNVLLETSSTDRSSRAAARAAAESRAGTRLGSQRGRAASERSVYFEGTDRFIGGDVGAGAIQPPADGSGITLNLVSVPIEIASKTVLSDILKVNYFIDPRVQGNVTIQTTNPVSPDGLVDMFEAALGSIGGAIVQQDGLLKVVPAADVKTSQPKLRIGRTTGGKNAVGKFTQVVPLRHISASEMRRILEPISPPDAIVRTDDSRNIIVLQGSRQELASMLDNVSVFDVDWLRGMSFALIPVKTSDPEAIADELETVFANKKNGPLENVVRFVPNKRLQSILVITSQSQYLRRATAWIRRLDAAARGNEKQLFVYSIQNREADELAELIQRVFSVEVQTSIELPDTVAPDLQPAVVSVQTPNPDGRSSSVEQQQLSPDGRGDRQAPAADPAAAATPESRITVVADATNNSLLILATPDDYDRVLEVLLKLDVIGKQVLLEATIAEVRLTDELKFGLKWFFESGNSSFTLSDAMTGIVAPTFPGFSYFFSTPKISVALDALQSITDVNVISSPSLMVLDNRTAVLQIGDEVPILTQEVQSVEATAPVINSIQYRDTGVILSVTPQVSDSGRVTLDIEQEVSNAVPGVTGGISSPTIQQRKVKTTVVVQDGASLALGGMIQVRDTDTRSQIPILGEVPILGNLFKQKSDAINKTELLIIITPSVVRDLNEARKVTDEFRRQLNVRIPRQRKKPSTEENVKRLLD